MRIYWLPDKSNISYIPGLTTAFDIDQTHFLYYKHGDDNNIKSSRFYYQTLIRHMQNITDSQLLNNMKSYGALFILFGGAHCSVCQTLKPRLFTMLEQQFPDMQAAYIDCEKSPDICAQHGVFTLPVVQAYIDGMKIAEFGRSFSLKQLSEAINRPYVIWKSDENI